MTIGCRVLLVVSTIAGGSFASAATPVARAKVVDYDLAFAQAFPGQLLWTAPAAGVAGRSR